MQEYTSHTQHNEIYIYILKYILHNAHLLSYIKQMKSKQMTQYKQNQWKRYIREILYPNGPDIYMDLVMVMLRTMDTTTPMPTCTPTPVTTST